MFPAPAMLTPPRKTRRCSRRARSDLRPLDIIVSPSRGTQEMTKTRLSTKGIIAKLRKVEFLLDSKVQLGDAIWPVGVMEGTS